MEGKGAERGKELSNLLQGEVLLARYSRQKAAAARWCKLSIQLAQYNSISSVPSAEQVQCYRQSQCSPGGG